MPRITYSEDSKRAAVRLVTDEGHARKQVARDLGTSTGALRGWIHRYAPGKAVISDKLPDPSKSASSSARCTGSSKSAIP